MVVFFTGWVERFSSEAVEGFAGRLGEEQIAGVDELANEVFVGQLPPLRGQLCDLCYEGGVDNKHVVDSTAA